MQKLSWQDFEHRVADVYRQKGFNVEELGGGGPDGGIDLQLSKNGLITVVQCKHWQKWKVGVREIRELFGVMTAGGADGAIFIASGRYTSDARRFAEGKPIQLIGREEFIALVRQFQRELRNDEAPASPSEKGHVKAAAPTCPRCQSSMVLRTARSGAKAGKQFWGCSTFPNCRGTISIS